MFRKKPEQIQICDWRNIIIREWLNCDDLDKDYISYLYMLVKDEIVTRKILLIVSLSSGGIGLIIVLILLRLVNFFKLFILSIYFEILSCIIGFVVGALLCYLLKRHLSYDELFGIISPKLSFAGDSSDNNKSISLGECIFKGIVLFIGWISTLFLLTGLGPAILFGVWVGLGMLAYSMETFKDGILVGWKGGLIYGIFAAFYLAFQIVLFGVLIIVLFFSTSALSSPQILYKTLHGHLFIMLEIMFYVSLAFIVGFYDISIEYATEGSVAKNFNYLFFWWSKKPSEREFNYAIVQALKYDLFDKKTKFTEFTTAIKFDKNLYVNAECSKTITEIKNKFFKQNPIVGSWQRFGDDFAGMIVLVSKEHGVFSAEIKSLLNVRSPFVVGEIKWKDMKEISENTYVGYDLFKAGRCGTYLPINVSLNNKIFEIDNVYQGVQLPTKEIIALHKQYWKFLGRIKIYKPPSEEELGIG